MSRTTTPTAAQRRLLELPIYAALATVRPDGTPQVNPMWFAFDGEHLRFTHLRTRQKFRNLQANDAMAVSLLDPDNPFSYLEIRGRLAEVVDDPTGAFYVELQNRYGDPSSQPPPDAADRVVLVMGIERLRGR